MKISRSAFDKSKNKIEGGMDKDYDSPLKVKSKPNAEFTSKARRNGTSGTVLLVVEFGGDGKIGYIFPYKPLPDGLTENAELAARKIKFEPAVKNGKSVSVMKFLEYKFDVK